MDDNTTRAVAIVGTVDQTLPRHSDESSKRQPMIDSALEMADRLVAARYNFSFKTLVRSAGHSLGEWPATMK